MLAIMRKELADSFNSVRFFVLFLLVLAASGLSLFSIQHDIRSILEQSGAIENSGFVFLAMFTPSLNLGYAIVTPFSLLVPILGIALGFDAINTERTGGTMSRLLAQPVYRDGVINGKFLAGLITMTLMVGTNLLLIAGFGLRMVGVPPSAEEIIRLFIYLVITIIYGAFWMALAVLFSVLFRRAAGSLLIPIALFLLLFFFWMMLGIGPAIANAIAPATGSSSLDLQIKNVELQQTLLRISPSDLFQESFLYLLNPVVMGMGIVTMDQVAFMVPNPLSLSQTLLAVWPHMVGLVSLSVIFFAISYIVFMKQEIRAT
jgi:ABC-2 type transport system permease protein